MSQHSCCTDRVFNVAPLEYKLVAFLLGQTFSVNRVVSKYREKDSCLHKMAARSRVCQMLTLISNYISSRNYTNQNIHGIKKCL